MLDNLSITLAQINPVVGDLRGNAELILKVAGACESDLIIFPELSICGYPPEDLVLKPSFVQACMDKVQEIAIAAKELPCALLIGSPWAHGDIGSLPYNAAVLVYKGDIIGITHKYDLPNYSVFDEKRTFSAGELPKPIAFKSHQLGVMICEDMWSDAPAHSLKKHGADILIVPNGSPFTSVKYKTRLKLAQKRVAETGLPLVYVNQVGGQDELVFDGGSFILDAEGNTMAQLPFFEDCIFMHPDASQDLESSISQIKFGMHTSFELEHIYKALKLGLHDYVRKNGFSGVLLGLSGGVDSALVATIAVDALGAENVSCYMLPSKFTSKDSLDDAAELAHNLGVTLETISIEEPLKAFEGAMELSGLAHENIQSRIRGTILMAISNSIGKMLITTGNKSEMAVGYATIYGDMNGGFNPLKDVYKTLVYKLCHWRNNMLPTIPENILTKAPTAELRDNQTDQDSLPEYDILDGILQGLIEGEKSLDDLIKDGFERDTILKIWTLLDRNEYKRYQSPPGTKITTKAFGRDRRYPMTNGFVKNLDKIGI